MILHGNYGESEKLDREGKYEFRVMTKVSLKKIRQFAKLRCNVTFVLLLKNSSNCQGYTVKIKTNVMFSRVFFLQN